MIVNFFVKAHKFVLQQKYIYIANCSKASIMSYNLIWLIDPDYENYCWERDWIHEILSLIKYRELFDTDTGKPKVASLPPVGEFTNNVWLREASADLGLPLNNAIIVMNRSVTNFNSYFQKYEEQELDYVVIHLGDEAYTDDKEFYKNEHCKYILRNYFTLKYVNND